jgi:hypothetical protein
MKQLFTLTAIVALLLSSTFIFNSCKKGKDDPFLSFRSRNARLEGKWILKKIDGSRTNTNKTDTTTYTSTNTTAYDGSNQTITTNASYIYKGSEQKVTVISTTSYSLSIEIKKDGTYDIIETTSNTSLTQTSTPSNTSPDINIFPITPSYYNLGNNGSGISGLTYDGSYSYKTNTSTYTTTYRWQWLDGSSKKEYVLLNGNAFGGLLYIDQLKNKQLILVDDGSSKNTSSQTAGQNNSYYTNSGEGSTNIKYTFEQ